MRQAHSDGVKTETIRAAKDPLQGWHSPVYGSMVENTVATFHKSGSSANFVTLIASGPLAQSIPTIRADSTSEPFQLTVCGPDAGIAVAITLEKLALAGETVQVLPADGCW
jgi:hypothetical protein